MTANLLENALRYSPSPARVEVNAESTGTQVLLRVVDHGPGLTATDKEHLFQPFKRLGDAPAGDGVGLGLAVAAGLTRALGGRPRPTTPPAAGSRWSSTCRWRPRT